MSHQPQPAGQPYFPALDGLRALAVLAVFAIHLNGYTYPGGWLGVDVFFVLSGFLITFLLLREWRETGTIDLKAFYVRRGLRLLPALFVMLAVVWVYAECRLSKEEIRITRVGVLSTVGYYANWRLSAGCALYDLLPHTWSLSLEEQFYFVWPPVLYLMLRLGCGRRFIAAAVVAMITAAAAYRGFTFRGMANFLPSYMSFRTRVDSLLVGCLAGLFVTWHGLPRSRGGRRALRLLGAATLPYLYWVFRNQQNVLAWWHCGGFTFLAAAAAVLLLAVLDGLPLVAPVLRFAPIAWLGRLSYGFYLWHFPVMAVLRKSKRVGRWPEWKLALVAFAAALLVSAVSHYAVERPFLRLKRRRRTSPVEVNPQSEPGRAAAA